MRGGTALRRTLAVLLLLAPLAALAALRLGYLELPPRWNPWAPLDVRDATTWVTGYKLQRLQSDDAACRVALDSSTLRYETVPDRTISDTCRIEGAVRVESGSLRFSQPFVATCGLAAALAMFEHHVLQPAARVAFDEPVVAIEHFGSYACRNIYGREEGRPSEHATANALDVSGMRFASGRRITIAGDWAGDDQAGRFLRVIRDGACHWFNGVLGPEYNAAHHDHLHLDMGAYRVCR